MLLVPYILVGMIDRYLRVPLSEVQLKNGINYLFLNMHRIFGKTVLQRNHSVMLISIKYLSLVLNLCLDSLLHLLISCYRRDNKATVECLLTQCPADPNCTS